MYDEFVPSNSELKNYPCNLRQLLSVYEWLVNRRPGKAVYYNHWVDFWYRGPHKFASQSRKDSISEEERCHSTRDIYHGIPDGSWDKICVSSCSTLRNSSCFRSYSIDRRGLAYPYCRFPIDFLFAWVGARFEKVYTRRPIREDIKSMPGLKKVSDMLSFMYAISTPFDSKRARQHLRDERNFIWRPYSFNCSGEGWVHEVINMRGMSDFPEEVQEWIISLRHSVLPLRLGGSLYAQPYNPRRLPGNLASTGVLAGYWLDLTQISLSLKFFIPDGSRCGKPSSYYARWWTNSLYSYFQHGVNFLVERESCPKKKNEDLPEGPISSPLSFELCDSSKRIEILRNFPCLLRGASFTYSEGIVEELPLPTLEGFTLPIPRDTVEELHSAAPIEVEQILPSHYDDEVDYEPSPSPPPRISHSSKELDSMKEKIEGKSAEAERELIEAKEGHIATTELATLRDLITNFENYRKNI
uniref:Aminotransferase-like plant mobile domain-containing protein n=1 Tax=Ananas comosus var. bracteatus TaxID=296719 RepID=A0A6V7P983_ANACO|nr:unnamed protein product [Ananas comosus var. bracteatus]